jgi:hypothetical protein
MLDEMSRKFASVKRMLTTFMANQEKLARGAA